MRHSKRYSKNKSERAKERYRGREKRQRDSRSNSYYLDNWAKEWRGGSRIHSDGKPHKVTDLECAHAFWLSFGTQNSGCWVTLWEYHSRLNVCVPVKFICWNLTPITMAFGGGAFGRRLGHEGGALTNEINALLKTPEKSFTRSAEWGHRNKMAVYEPGS